MSSGYATELEAPHRVVLEGLAALAELRQRVADLETFYDYEEDSGSVLKQMNEFWMLAKNHDSWKEHAEWFEALVKRCHRD